MIQLAEELPDTISAARDDAVADGLDATVVASLASQRMDHAQERRATLIAASSKRRPAREPVRSPTLSPRPRRALCLPAALGLCEPVIGAVALPAPPPIGAFSNGDVPLQARRPSLEKRAGITTPAVDPLCVQEFNLFSANALILK